MSVQHISRCIICTCRSESSELVTQSHEVIFQLFCNVDVPIGSKVSDRLQEVSELALHDSFGIAQCSTFKLKLQSITWPIENFQHIIDRLEKGRAHIGANDSECRPQLQWHGATPGLGLCSPIALFLRDSCADLAFYCRLSRSNRIVHSIDSKVKQKLASQTVPLDLPAGLLNLATPELVVREIKFVVRESEHRGRIYNAAWNPTNRIEDFFVTGEGKRSHTRFFKSHAEHPKDLILDSSRCFGL